jgi:hypothetical protein
MDKKGVEVIKEQRRKENEETKKMCTTYSQSAIDRTIQRLVEKRHRANFNQVWLTFVIKGTCDIFH